MKEHEEDSRGRAGAGSQTLPARERAAADLPLAPRLVSIRDRADIPSKLPANPDCTYLVPDMELGEILIRHGAESSQLAHAEQGSFEEWDRALAERRGFEPLTPPRPRSFPFSVLVVLPTYNERQNLGEMVEAIEKYLACSILVVDDNSPDGTGELADELAAARENLYVIHRSGKLGLGTAYIAGFKWALESGYDRVIEMDCDFSHAPWDLPRLVGASKDADLVIGSRYVRGGRTQGWAFHRRLLSKMANIYTKIFLGPAVHDWTAGFRCYRAKTLAALDLTRITASGYSFQIQMAWAVKKTGGRIREVPIHFVDRNRGTSKMDRSIAFEALRLVPTLRFGSP